ncbi:pyridine nucleotide-disulfide oxidoreductase domain-containing protein 1 [Anthonomus grandis grandis]|uniref:pyridine nucleotide-disulfide oxidoreductase domain-containing protein 1 n=1 Tax=Anthonomus grandis grandis TaxID=2921223 RepID=UPI002166002C|nr:pyridine nucleotide-disulfide oxidoreductase domain-containing protein 1 [Anthonomus grandis grandis]
MQGDFVVVGGGIAGVSCAETLAFLQPEKTIILVSESSLIKTVTNLHAITKTIVSFDVKEAPSNSLCEKYSNISIVHDTLKEILDDKMELVTKNGAKIKYTYLCLCMGAEPKLIAQAEQFPDYIIGIRDTDSVDVFLDKLKHSKKILVVGNGGIASEIVYKVQDVQINWVVKDNHISATFVDPGAAEFFQDSIHSKTPNAEPISKRMRYQEDELHKSGAALGPDWYKSLVLSGSSEKQVTIHYKSEVANVAKIDNNEHPIEVTLTNGEKIICDLIVSATGVTARRNFKTTGMLHYSEDGGVKVDEYMRTNLTNIYAAGDVCTANWQWAKHWFQMKLWTQARQMGAYAAKSMSGHLNGEEILQDFCFEIFTHSTKLFGYKVILLGLYNGQKLGNQYEILVRTTKSVEYIKFVIENHKLQGAVLIGDTDLEEMCENLICNQIDLEPYGDDILNPDIDIEDYFD